QLEFLLFQRSHNDSIAVIDSCTLFTNAPGYTAISINGVLNVIGSSDSVVVTNSTISRFSTAIATDGSACRIYQDSLKYNSVGVKVEGISVMSQMQNIED